MSLQATPRCDRHLVPLLRRSVPLSNVGARAAYECEVAGWVLHFKDFGGGYGARDGAESWYAGQGMPAHLILSSF